MNTLTGVFTVAEARKNFPDALKAKQNVDVLNRAEAEGLAVEVTYVDAASGVVCILMEVI